MNYLNRVLRWPYLRLALAIGDACAWLILGYCILKAMP